MERTKKTTKLLAISALLFSLSVGFVLGVVFIVGTGGRDTDPVYALDASTGTGTDVIPASFRGVVDKVVPVVVQINVVDKETVPSTSNWPWDFFLPQDQQPDQERLVEGLGSGIIVRRENDKVYVLTNNHVVEGADDITVVLNDKREFKAEVTGTSPRQDFALIEFKTGDKDIRIASLGDSDRIYVGDWVMAIGNPLGYFSTVTAGIVSAIGRSGPAGNINEFIQTDAAINQGNSGGALVNLNGEVVGMNTWIATTTGENIGLGFALPINTVKKAIDDLISKGKIEFGYLGVLHGELTDDMKASLKVSGQDGNIIEQVIVGTPADKGGLQAGDFVISVNGKKVLDMDDFGRYIGELSPGEVARLELVRNGKLVTQNVTLGIRPDDDSASDQALEVYPGISVLPLTDQVRSYYSIDVKVEGIVVSAISSSFKSKFQLAGLRRGDVIVKINDLKITDLAGFYRIINDPSVKELRIEYSRQGAELFIGIKK